MATSGSSYHSFARHRIVAEWSTQSQNISGNYSMVTGKLFLQSMDAYGAIYASAQGAVNIWLNGQKQSGTNSSQVSANQKKLLLAKDWKVGHNANGTKTFPMSGNYNVNVTFAGVYYGVRTVNDFNGTLNTIPRHSSLNAVPTFTPPNGCSVSITRNSNFTHGLTFWVQNTASPTLTNDAHWTWIADLSNVATSGTFNFNASQMKTIAARMNQYKPGGGQIQGKVKLWTNGVSGLSAQRTVQINVPTAGSPNPSNVTLKAGNVLNCWMSNRNSSSRFTYDYRLDCAGWSRTWTNTRADLAHPLTQDDVNQMQSRFIAATSNGAKITITSKLDGQQFRATTEKYFTVYVDTSLSSPTANTTFTFLDTNSKSIAITGSNQKMMQNVSTMQVTVPSSALAARGYGQLKKVEVSFGGVNSSRDYASGNMVFNLGEVKTGATGALVVKVTDSRGLTGSNSKSVTVLPYQFPVSDATVTRKNSFEAEVTIQGNIVYSVLSGTPYKISGVSYQIGYGTITPIAFTEIRPGVAALTPMKFDVNIADTALIKIYITDNIGTFSRQYTLSKGKPILFINSFSESVSIGNLTGASYSGTLPGVLEIEAERYHTTGKTGIQMNNSDISGINGLWFSTDVMNNNGEGLHFLRSGAEANVTKSDGFYDHMYMRDGSLYINSDSQIAFTVSPNGDRLAFPRGPVLWQGGWWMTGSQTVTPTKNLTDCRNGWCLIFNKYIGGVSTPTADIGMYFISKDILHVAGSGLGMRAVYGGYGDKVEQKYLIVSNTQITGNNGNDTVRGSQSIMTRVCEW